MEYIWEINGLALDFDLEDAETADKYAEALDKLKNTKLPQKTDAGFTLGGYIRAYCESFRKFYDDIFGNGTAEKIFAETPCNIRKYNEVYESLLDFVGKQSENTVNQTMRIVKKYSPKHIQK